MQTLRSWPFASSHREVSAGLRVSWSLGGRGCSREWVEVIPKWISSITAVLW